MKEIHTEIAIEAPSDRVWRSLTDFALYPEWNPLIRRASGPLEVGARPDVLLGASGARETRFHPTVKKVVPNRELR